MIKYITKYFLDNSETWSGTTEIVLCVFCRWTSHILRSVFLAVFTIYLLGIWFPEQKDLRGISQQSTRSCEVSHLIIYAKCGQRVGTFFVTVSFSLYFWGALKPWRCNSLYIQSRSVPTIQGYSSILLGEILSWKFVASSHSCDFVPYWATPGQAGYICSSRRNRAEAELQHGHMVAHSGHCQHRASWAPHPAPGLATFSFSDCATNTGKICTV